VLKLLPDPERRANLHLRYLRDRPRMKTACCSREHCFRCQTKDFHEGKSCMESTETLDHSIVPCPSCGLRLTKGDGCNSFTCPCGKQFSWSAEKENADRCQQFYSSFPANTSTTCSVILCTNYTKIQHPSNLYPGKRSNAVLFDDDNNAPTRNVLPVNTSVVLQAKAWQQRNRVEVSREMRHLFESVHWPSPSQCCATISTHLHSEYVREEGMLEAAEIWKAEHAKEVERCASQNAFATQSLMETFYPDITERCVAAFKMLNAPHAPFKPPNSKSGGSGRLHYCPFATDRHLLDSARLWVERHREVYLRHAEAFEINCAKQFLRLYGSRSPLYTRATYSFTHCVSEWDRSTSNADLTYSQENTTVERVGSISCYPAAFCNLVSDHCTFKVMLKSAPKSSNWITFGLARKGMASSSSDGVGRTNNTWGLSDDRSSSTSHSLLVANGQEMSNFRKLRVGDVLSATVSLLENYCDISVNDNELQYRFNIPPGTMKDYCFAMTFANDHRVTIIYDDSNLTNSNNSPTADKNDQKIGGNNIIPQPQFVTLNSDQSRMMSALKKQLKLIIAAINSEKSTDNDSNAMQLLGDAFAWQQSCGGDHDEAIRCYNVLANEVEVLLNMRRKSPSSNSENSGNEEKCQLSMLSWNNILDALSWYRQHKEQILMERDLAMANHFYMVHGDDASFFAAMNLVEYHTHKVESDEQMASLAYMKIFESDMQQWYEYNASLEDPLIPNLNKRCRCVPRHGKKCPREVRS